MKTRKPKQGKAKRHVASAGPVTQKKRVTSDDIMSADQYRQDTRMYSQYGNKTYDVSTTAEDRKRLMREDYDDAYKSLNSPAKKRTTIPKSKPKPKTARKKIGSTNYGILKKFF